MVDFGPLLNPFIFALRCSMNSEFHVVVVAVLATFEAFVEAASIRIIGAADGHFYLHVQQLAHSASLRAITKLQPARPHAGTGANHSTSCQVN